MYQCDIDLIVCPVCQQKLKWNSIQQSADDDEVLEAVMVCQNEHEYVVTRGIPRMVEIPEDNESWDFKWTKIDRGQGLNYKILDKEDPAYEIHDLFDRNSYDGKVFKFIQGKVAADFGCGIGQYTIKLLQEANPEKVISMDLTGGVDIFRKILLERFPEYKRKVLIVQGDILRPPLAPGTLDFLMSLGVLMHTGKTLDAIRNCCRLIKNEGFMNIWIYASEPVPFEAQERGHSGAVRSPFQYIPLCMTYSVVLFWLKLFRVVPRKVSLAILKFFSTHFWYKMCTTPLIRSIANRIFMCTAHPDKDYRYINHYDGYFNNYQDSWNEHEIFPVLREEGVVIQKLSPWRLGILGQRMEKFVIN